MDMKWDSSSLTLIGVTLTFVIFIQYKILDLFLSEKYSNLHFDFNFMHLIIKQL